MEDLVAKAKQTIIENSFMVIATSDGQKPWISPVFYANDQQYNFFWHSGPTTKHSQLIKKNQNIAIVIFNSTNPELPALYMEGKAEEVNGEELMSGLHVLFQKAIKDEEKRARILSQPEDFMGDGKLRLYKFSPKKFYTNSSETWHEKWVDWHTEVPLPNK